MSAQQMLKRDLNLTNSDLLVLMKELVRKPNICYSSYDKYRADCKRNRSVEQSILKICLFLKSFALENVMF